MNLVDSTFPSAHKPSNENDNNSSRSSSSEFNNAFIRAQSSELEATSG